MNNSSINVGAVGVVVGMVITFSTIVSGQIERTLAVELVRQVDTSSRWRARVFLAVDYVLVAVLARESRWTHALVAGPVVHARRAVFTRVGLTGVEFVLAPDPVVIARARAVQSRSEVLTPAAVHARIADATFRCGFALFAVRSGWTSKIQRKHGG